MTNPSPLSVEEVLGQLLDEFEWPSRRAIAEFSARYPQYREELIAFAITWAEEEHLPEAPALTTEQEALVATRAQSFLQNLLHEREVSVEPAAAELVAPAVPVQTLAQLASDAGMTPHEAARAVGLELDLMGEINRRGILPETIPKWLANAFARLFSIDVGRVVASWTQPAARAPALAFMATSKPIVPPQRSFEEAVRSSTTLTDEQKAHLLRHGD